MAKRMCMGPNVFRHRNRINHRMVMGIMRKLHKFLFFIAIIYVCVSPLIWHHIFVVTFQLQTTEEFIESIRPLTTKERMSMLPTLGVISAFLLPTMYIANKKGWFKHET